MLFPSSPLQKTSSPNKGGAPSTVDYAFGCTEEKLRKLVPRLHVVVFGLKQIGSPSDDKYDRTKGAGYVAECDGQYADALSRNITASRHRDRDRLTPGDPYTCPSFARASAIASLTTG